MKLRVDIASLILFPMRAWREWRLRRLTREALALLSLGADRAPEFEVALALWLLKSKDHVRVWLEVTAFSEEAARSMHYPELSTIAVAINGRGTPPSRNSAPEPRAPAIAARAHTWPWNVLTSRATVAALAMGVALLFCGALWVRYESSGHAEYFTRIGEHRSFQLPDGTSVHLNTNSRISVSFTHERRHVELLQGEALFAVAHEARPFRVRSGTAVIEDIGTRFDVRLDAHQIDVSVMEGQVRIGITPQSKSAQAWPRVAVDTLNAGESVSIPTRADAEPPVVERHTAETLGSRLAWTMGMLQFHGDSLQDAVREINRYNVRQIEIADPGIADKRIGGQFLATSPDRFARALHSVGVSALEPPGGWRSNEPIRLVSARSSSP